MIHETLCKVRRRLWFAALLRGGTVGLLAGICLALAAAVVRLVAFPAISWAWAPALVVAGTICGVLAGAFRRRGDAAAARLIDDHYGLKDGSITALQFVSEPGADAVRRMQVEETEQRLQQVDPVQCVPLQASEMQLRWAGALSVATILILLIGTWSAPQVEAKPVLPLAQDQAGELRETLLADLEELAAEQQDPQLEQLIEELEQKIEDLDSEALDESDLLATLSEMEQSLAEAREALQLDMTDAVMKALAAALRPSDALREAAKAIEAEDYDEAGEQLASIDPAAVSDKQRRAVADNLKKMVSKLKPGQQGQLSDTISQLAEGLESKNESQCKQCLSKLASACKTQGQCKKIGNCMACQLNRLAQCKSQCRGQSAGNGVAKSDSPSQSAGSGASGQPLGEQATSINSVRQEQQLSGAQSDGPSETEILQAPEGEQQAARQYAARYNRFRKEAEAVLDSEPLPMGHRETVRTYFEAIRPANDIDAEVIAE